MSCWPWIRYSVSLSSLAPGSRPHMLGGSRWSQMAVMTLSGPGQKALWELSIYFFVFPWYFLPAPYLGLLPLRSPLEPRAQTPASTSAGSLGLAGLQRQGRLCEGVCDVERCPLTPGGVFHLLFGGRKWGISVFTGKSKGISFWKRPETDFSSHCPHLPLTRLLWNSVGISHSC